MAIPRRPRADPIQTSVVVHCDVAKLVFAIGFLIAVIFHGSDVVSLLRP
jgi:hypothetical protein